MFEPLSINHEPKTVHEVPFYKPRFKKVNTNQHCFTFTKRTAVILSYQIWIAQKYTYIFFFFSIR